MIAAVELGHHIREILRGARRPLDANEVFERMRSPRRIEGADGTGESITAIELELARLHRAGLVERVTNVAAPYTWKAPC
ncbi:MAG: hypothetical protein WDM85_01275 [Caulobacteraceae bacterium]